MTSDNPHKILGLGPRCAAWLRQQYPTNRGKLIARDFRVHPNTAWRWLSGVAPTTAHLEEMYARWGRSWLEFIFVEAFETHDAKLAQLEMIDAQIQRLEAERIELVRVAQSAESIAETPERDVTALAEHGKFERVPIRTRHQVMDQLVKEIPRPSFALGRRLTSAVVGAFRTLRHSNRVTAWLGPGPE